MGAFEIIQLIILALSALLIIPQLYFIKKQITDGHEEHRRENTANIMHMWCTSLHKEASIAEEVVRKFTEDQCSHLYNHKPFYVSDDVAKDVCKFCTISKGACETCTIKQEKKLDGKIHNELRYHVISYLNMLETVMTSWHLGIVDRLTIEREFKFLVEGPGLALDAFRRKAGGYPCIEEFIDKIKAKGDPPKKGL